jgi:hypothetical protein
MKHNFIIKELKDEGGGGQPSAFLFSLSSTALRFLWPVIHYFKLDLS